MTLLKKLKFKNNHRILVLNAPQNYCDIVGLSAKEFNISENVKQKPFDVIHLFATNKNALTKYGNSSVSALAEDGMLWISFPKKASKVQTDLTRDHGWDEFLKFDLHFKTLISFDETWSAILFQKGEKLTKKVKSNAESDLVNQFIDVENRIVYIPEDLKSKFKTYPSEAEFFASLSFTNRKEYVCWLITAKKSETRIKRLDATIEKLKQNKNNPSER